jgi:hypothetical protein
MRHQLRLRVVLPVAVLALLGAGVGAYASGGGGGGSEGSEFVVTHTSKPKASSGVSPALWAKKANAACARGNADVRALRKPQSIVQVESYLVKVLAVAERMDAQLAALGFPKGKTVAAKQLLRTSRTGTAAGQELLAAFRTGDGKAFKAALASGKRINARFAALALRLGADTCAQDDSEVPELKKAKRPSEALLRVLLLRYSTVVVVFYSPASRVDGAAVYEARAAAVELNAGFLPVNAASDAAVTKFAATYQVHSSPAILVVGPGPKVVAKFEGFADRKTVAQAISDARR